MEKPYPLNCIRITQRIANRTVNPNMNFALRLSQLESDPPESSNKLVQKIYQSIRSGKNLLRRAVFALKN